MPLPRHNIYHYVLVLPANLQVSASSVVTDPGAFFLSDLKNGSVVYERIPRFEGALIEEIQPPFDR
jgi:hypothetical protein